MYSTDDSQAKSYDTVCRALSDRIDPSAWAAFTSPEWGTFEQDVRTGHVAPLLYWKFNQQGWPEGLPSAIRAHLTTAFYAEVAQNARFYAELERVLGALEQAKIPVVVLKGAALAKLLYPDPALRPFGDFDLLVQRQSLEAALDVIYSIGYVKEHDMTAPRLEQRVGYEIHLVGGDRQSNKLGLHWNLIAGDADWRSPPMHWFWENTEVFPSKPDMRVLSPEANLLHLAAHLLLKHGMVDARLIWFYDIHLLVSRLQHRMDWEEVLERAVQFRWAEALRVVLQEVAARFGTPLPQDVLDSLSKVQDDQSKAFVDMKMKLIRTRGFRGWSNLSPLDWRTRLSRLWGILFPAPEYLRWRFRPRPLWLWPACYIQNWFDLLHDILLSLAAIVKQRGKIQ